MSSNEEYNELVMRPAILGMSIPRIGMQHNLTIRSCGSSSLFIIS